MRTILLPEPGARDGTAASVHDTQRPSFFNLEETEIVAVVAVVIAVLIVVKTLLASRHFRCR